MDFRPVEQKDKDAIIRLIDSIFREYGDRLCLDDADRDLLDLSAHYEQDAFMVLEDDGRIVGTVALKRAPDRPHTGYLRRMYLAPTLRGSGHADRMTKWALQKALELGMTRVEFWTDTRFERAHAFYRKIGFQTDGTVRTMHDGWEPYDEYFFAIDLQK